MKSFVLGAACLVCSASAFAQDPVTYRLSFPEPEHHWMQVEATFPQAGTASVSLRMSRSSPGRYAVHEFAKNVYDVTATDASGRTLRIARPNPHQWDVSDHNGTVRVTYRVYGDRVDGTYLAIDASHAHINMPAALMWARGFDRRPARVTVQAPPGRRWRVATQLHPTGAPDTFEAANLQYLMDSPIELSEYTERTFLATAPDGGAATIRVALHHDGTDAEADSFVRDVARIVREACAVFGEFPPYETGSYTFLADYLPYASGDGMEHRNSTVLTSPGALRDAGQRAGNLGAVSHEFFHGWNVERIRPRSLEPFDFEDANMSGELWLAEGFTQYYGDLLMHRAGLEDLPSALRGFAQILNSVVNGPARQVRTAEEMSRMAPFVDAARPIDRTNFQNTYISYYTHGAAIALGLDLSLRDRTGGKVTLDDYMRQLWDVFGKPGGKAEGLVDKPYTIDEARAQLAAVSGDRAFANEFFDRYIQGHDAVDYTRLLGRAGLIVRRSGQASLGDARFEASGGGLRLTNAAPFGSPIYKAGLDQDDVLMSLDGQDVGSTQALDQFLRASVPGKSVQVAFTRRSGEKGTATVALVEDPRMQIVPAESAGQTLTGAQREFRDAWLKSRVK